MAKSNSTSFTAQHLKDAQRKGFPKSRRYPKAPKVNAPVKSWESYQAKVLELKKAVSTFISDKKKREAIVSKARKIAGI